jgi:membrane protease YdiL (CAAX protease family)
MLAKWLRKWFGSVRLALTLIAIAAGLLVVFLDLYRGLRLSSQLYGYLASLAGVVAVFVWKDTDRPSGYTPAGGGYIYRPEHEGEV